MGYHIDLFVLAALKLNQGWRFLFFIGVAVTIGAVGDDQRGPRACAREVTEPILLYLGHVFRQLPNRLVACHEAFCTASNEKPWACR